MIVLGRPVLYAKPVLGRIADFADASRNLWKVPYIYKPSHKMAEGKLCFQCDKNPRLHGNFLCRSCMLDHKFCYECGEKERNLPYKLCIGCYEAQRNRGRRRSNIISTSASASTFGGPLCESKYILYYIGYRFYEPDLSISLTVPQKITILNRLDSDQQTYKDVSKHFQKEWVKLTSKCPTPPNPLAIYAIQNKQLSISFHEYSDKIRRSDQQATNSDLFFHGTKLTCNLLETNDCCQDTDCGICGISSNGFDPSRIGSNIPRFQRFGRGIYLAPNSSKCHDYTQGNPFFNVRAQLLCLVACGAKYELLYDNTSLSAPPDQHHSVYGKSGGSLNYDEIVVFDTAAVMPQFIVVYKLDGVDKIAK